MTRFDPFRFPLPNSMKLAPGTTLISHGHLFVGTDAAPVPDAANLRAKNAPEATPFIQRAYRTGWSL